MTQPIAALGLNDPVGSLTHLIGAGVFFILAIPLLKKAWGCRVRSISLMVFTGSAVLLLMASGLFHALPSDTAVREVFKRLDHAAIFILIAGTMTPIHCILFKGALRWGVLVPIWVAAILGITLKMVFFESTPEWLGVLIYLLMGWSGTISVIAVWRRYNLRFVSPLIVGGLAYTVGTLCEFTGEPTLIEGVFRSHEMFHIAVLVGLGSMWGFISRVARLEPVLVSADQPDSKAPPCKGNALLAGP